MRFNLFHGVGGVPFSIRPDRGMLTLASISSWVHFRVYRLAGYLLLNVLDDPALLALMFC